MIAAGEIAFVIGQAQPGGQILAALFREIGLVFTSPIPDSLRGLRGTRSNPSDVLPPWVRRGGSHVSAQPRSTARARGIPR